MAEPSPGADVPVDVRRPRLLTLRVRDLTASLDFYHELLGIPVKLRTEGHAELQTETVIVALIEDEEAGAPGDSPALGFEVSDLDAAAAELDERGVELGPVSGGSGDVTGRRRAFRDPDGHRLEIVEY